MEVAEKEPLTGTALARSILRRYMADYTTSTTPPRNTVGGFFAILMKDTGEVWLSETNDFKGVMRTFNKKGSMAHCVEEAIKRGSPLELWLLTQPQRFSAQKLEDELFTNNLLTFRKTREMSGPGKLYCIRHDLTHDYFVATDRTGRPASGVLGQFLRTLTGYQANSRNKYLSDFITTQADDILKGKGFSINFIDKFDDTDDEWLKRQLYIDDCKFGKNLNWRAVD